MSPHLKNYRIIKQSLVAELPTVILKLIIIARDEDPDFSSYTSLREVVEAMIKDKDLKERIVQRLHADESRYTLN